MASRAMTRGNLDLQADSPAMQQSGGAAFTYIVSSLRRHCALSHTTLCEGMRTVSGKE